MPITDQASATGDDVQLFPRPVSKIQAKTLLVINLNNNIYPHKNISNIGNTTTNLFRTPQQFENFACVFGLVSNQHQLQLDSDTTTVNEHQDNQPLEVEHPS